MRKSILLILFISSLSFAQMIPTGIFTELHVLKNDGKIELNICFRISYNSLVFKKENSKFRSQYVVSAEVADSTGKTLVRESISKIILIESFESTNSPLNFSEGVLKMTVRPSGDRIFNQGIGFSIPEYNLNALIKISDSNTEREIELPPQRIYPVPGGEVFSQQIVLMGDGEGATNEFQMTNFGGRILFTSEKQILLFPVEDTSITSLKIKIMEKEDPEEDEAEFIHELTINDYFDGSFSIEESGNKLSIRKTETSGTRYFVLKDFTQKLSEGFAVFEVSDSVSKRHSSFPIPVFWYNKPLSAHNEDFIIQALIAVEDKNVIDELQSGSSDERKLKFRKYWESIDPTPGTKFNELREEFFARVDYAIRNFSSLNKMNGHQTDRGKIYIRYGSPSEIIRGVNKYGRITESWIYKDMNREFIFTDRTGTNNFQLL